MNRWLPALFSAGLIFLAGLAFFDIFGFDAIGPYLRGSSHTHRSAIALATAFWLVAGWVALRLSPGTTARVED